MSALKRFLPYRNQIVGHDASFVTSYGKQHLLYADWVASGRLYEPIEKYLTYTIGPFVGNTHTEATVTGSTTTQAYLKAKKIIKKHVNASEDDIFIAVGSGSTGSINKLQRILGLRIPCTVPGSLLLNNPHDKPVVFITHLEHHSNHTSWLETIAEVVILPPGEDGQVSITSLAEALKQYKNSTFKIGAFSAASNVTGIQTSYHQLAELMHFHNGYCFVDFAASAPYVDINMHPPGGSMQYLDAIYFSSHKFLGGVGGSGILIFNKNLYRSTVPDIVGGGTVQWTNPWGEHAYVEDIEEREDGGTPPFMQTIKASLAVQLKEEWGTAYIYEREKELLEIVFPRLEKIPGLHILDGHIKNRLGILSFYFTHIHYNLVVQLLNDRFGIQARGGCSCAGTYGHYLLQIDKQTSNSITSQIDAGNNSCKPGWVRISLHPVMTNEEAVFICDAINQIRENIVEWRKDYVYHADSNVFINQLSGGDVLSVG
jgi:selenocysteine lyase/cysteine desulfurase